MMGRVLDINNNQGVWVVKYEFLGILYANGVTTGITVTGGVFYSALNEFMGCFACVLPTALFSNLSYVC